MQDTKSVPLNLSEQAHDIGGVIVISGEYGFGFCAHFQDYCGEGPIAIGYTHQAAIDSLMANHE